MKNFKPGNVREVYLKSRQLSLQKYQKPTFGEDDYIDFYKKKNRKKFNSQQLEAFRLLFAWRDQIARSEDECTDYVIPGIDRHINVFFNIGHHFEKYHIWTFIW